MTAFLRDVRHAMRALSANPGFTVAAVVTMGIGVGATTAMFAIVNPVLLRPLPFAAADRLISIAAVRDGEPGRTAGVSLAELRDWREQSRAVEAFGAWRDWGMSRHDGDEKESVFGAIVTAEIFQVLPVTAQLGRVFRPDEDHPGRNQVVLLSDGYWRDRFGADPNVIGRTMVLERGPRATYTIIGVLPPSFSELPSFEDVQVFALSSIDPDAGLGRDIRNRRVIARLRSSVSLAVASSEMDVIASRLARQYPDTNSRWQLTVRPLVEAEVGPIGGALRALFLGVGFVLMIACANVAALQLARALARRREFSIRQAIGGRRTHVMRALMAEGLIIALAGGVAGLLLAGWLVDAMLAAGPAIARADAARVDLAVVVFATAACTAAGLLAAFPASLLTTRVDVVNGLREESGQVSSVSAQRWRTAFVGGQVALALVLLIGAALAAQTLLSTLRLRPGFDPADVATISVFVPIERKGREVAALYARAIEEARAVTGVTAASAVSSGPLFGGMEPTDVIVDGAASDLPRRARYFNAAPGYFATLRVPVRRGRDFAAGDRADTSAVAVINEAFARAYLGAADPIGRRVRLVRGDGDPLTIVGVVGDVLQDFRFGAAAEPEVYFPYSQAPRWATFIVVRAEQLQVALPMLRARIEGIDPEIRVGAPVLMSERIARSRRAPRFTLLLLGSFAGAALLLSAIGVYGLVSFSVAQRVREIGVRVSLGARPSDIMRLLATTGFSAVIAGSAIGLAGAIVIARLLASALSEMQPLRPGAALLAWALLVIVGAIACYVPARRALRIDPLRALRTP